MEASSPSSSGGSSRTELWDRVAAAILAAPGARDDRPELAGLRDKVRRHAYRIVDADVEGLDVDLVLEATLATAFDVADGQRRAALDALR
ncbi:MAG: hypothetical protein ACYDCH_10090 [Gaiellaceae bacterium]